MSTIHSSLTALAAADIGSHLADTNNPHAVTAAQTAFTAPGTGAISRNVAARLSEEISLFDFGAVGNGSTVDTTAVQAAINAASSSGKAVFTGHRNYTFIVGNLTLPRDVRFVGNGKLKGVTPVGTRPTRTDLTAAGSAAARLTLLQAYYQSTLSLSTPSAGTQLGELSLENMLITRSAGSNAWSIEGKLYLTTCATVALQLEALRGGVIYAPSLLSADCQSSLAALQVTDGGTVSAASSVIVGAYRGARIVGGGTIDIASSEIWNTTNIGLYVLYGGSLIFTSGILDTAGANGWLNNYGGHGNLNLAQIRNTGAVGIMCESNGAVYAQGATVSGCADGVAVALGGFIQMSGGSITTTTTTAVQVLNSGHIDVQGCTIDASGSTSKVVCRGSGLIQSEAPGVGTKAALVAGNFSPTYGTVGNGAAYIGLP